MLIDVIHRVKIGAVHAHIPEDLDIRGEDAFDVSLCSVCQNVHHTLQLLLGGGEISVKPFERFIQLPVFRGQPVLFRGQFGNLMVQVLNGLFVFFVLFLQGIVLRLNVSQILIQGINAGIAVIQDRHNRNRGCNQNTAQRNQPFLQFHSSSLHGAFAMVSMASSAASRASSAISSAVSVASSATSSTASCTFPAAAAASSAFSSAAS